MEVKMEQPLSGHIACLHPEHSQAIILLYNGQEIPVGRDCMQAGMFEHLHVGDRVWYFAKSGDGAYSTSSIRVVPISSRYGVHYGNGSTQPAI
jgi:hypothetical protein